MKRLFCTALLLALFGPVAHAVDEAVLREAKSFIDAGQPQQAYDLLKPREDEEAGNAAFDYLLGLAALDLGRRTEAIFALQRAVDVDPQNGPARAELARALMQVNETDAARRELETAQAQQPPEDARVVIDRYLAAIDQYHGAYRTSFQRYVKAGLGFDSNINSATDSGGRIATPGLGGLPFVLLPSNAREQSSAVWNVGAGFTFTSPLQEGLRLVGGIDFDYRLTPQDADFSTAFARGHGGLQWTRGRNQYSLIGQGERFFVDGGSRTDSDRQVGGATLQWRHTLNARTQFSVFGQGSMIRFPDQDARNVNRFVGGAALAHALPHLDGAPVVFLSAFGGTEDSQDNGTGLGGGRQYDRELYGLRIGGERQLGARGRLFGSFTWQASDYNGAVPLFGVARDDDFLDFSLGYRYRYDRNWSVTPTLSYINNDSNVVLNDYDRVEFMVVIRNDF